MFRKFAIGAASAVAIAGTALSMAGTASASTTARRAPVPQGVVHASTQVSNRLDSGNGGYWAKDQFGRDLWVKLIHQGGGTYTWSATLQDQGSFVTIPNAKGPNQSGPYTNKREGRRPGYGQFQGSDSFVFTTDSLPNHSWNAGVPSKVKGNSGEPTSTWYEQAFPNNTHFTNVQQGKWSWTYTAEVKTTKIVGWKTVWSNGHKHVIPITKTVTQHQKWVDSSSNSNHDGNAPFDGDILLP